MKEKLKTIYWLTPLIFILDQITKYLIDTRLAFGSEIEIIPGIFDIVHVRNRGAAFGFLSNWDSAYRDIFFYVLAIAATIFLFYFLKSLKESEKKMVYPIAMILGGALGNVFDRIFRGSVVDFLSFHWFDRSVSFNFFGKPIHFELIWPSFNVADSAITVSVILLLLMMQKKDKMA